MEGTLIASSHRKVGKLSCLPCWNGGILGQATLNEREREGKFFEPQFPNKKPPIDRIDGG